MDEYVEQGSAPAADCRGHLRVLVKGSSLVVMTPEKVSDRGEYTFPRWIHHHLTEAGHNVECWNAGVVSERTRSAFAEWDRQVMAWSPDAVVFGYGYYECIHAFLPHFLERHVNSRSWRPGTVRTRYRSIVLRPTWRVLAQVQRHVDSLLPTRFFRRRLGRVLDDYELLITRTRDHGHPLVLLLELLPPGGASASWFPGMTARIEQMNRGLRTMVDRLGDPDVRLVPVAELASSMWPDDPVPDGLHYSPRMRRQLGWTIAAEIARHRQSAG